MLKSVRTLFALAARAVVGSAGRPDFVGEVGRRLISLSAFAVVAVATAYVLPGGDLVIGAAVGWNVAAAVYLGLTWAFILKGGQGRARRWAAAQDAPRSRVLQRVFGRKIGLGVILVVSMVGLIMATGLLPGDPVSGARDAGLLDAASGLAVIEAWLVLQTSYGLYYAYLYYRPEVPAGGLVFPGDEEPNLLDFTYFAFTVGTAFAVSDVRVTSSRLRLVVIGHSLLSFAYNAAILTLAFGAVLNVAG